MVDCLSVFMNKLVKNFYNNYRLTASNKYKTLVRKICGNSPKNALKLLIANYLPYVSYQVQSLISLAVLTCNCLYVTVSRNNQSDLIQLKRNTDHRHLV